MQRFLIFAANCAVLVLLLIGLPAITHSQVGYWQLSSDSTGWQLLFWGLVVAAAGNGLAALALLKERKGRMLCWSWAAVFGGLLLACYGYRHGYFNFNWLKQALEWMQNHL